MSGRDTHHLFGVALAVVLGAVLLALVLAGCQTPTTVTTDAKAVTVRIRNLTFEPATLTINPGTTVTWTNEDDTAHTSTSDASGKGSWDSGVLNPGGSFKHTFDTAGTFTYHCQIHSYLTGKVIVR